MNILESVKQSSCKFRNFVFLNRKSLFSKIILTAVFVILTFILARSGIGCVWRYLFKIPCPGCGMTRAFLSFVHGDFKSAMKYHFMFPSVPVICMYIMFDGHIFKSKKTDTIILSVIGVGFLLHWIIDLVNL